MIFSSKVHNCLLQMAYGGHSSIMKRNLGGERGSCKMLRQFESKLENQNILSANSFSIFSGNVKMFLDYYVTFIERER